MIALDIALAHLRNRRRQTIVSVLGVAVGVGFFVAASSLLRGSENDFIARMVDAYPHITVRDDYRDPPVQPVRVAFPEGAVALEGVRPRDDRRGIRNYKVRLATLERMPGARVAPALSGQVILRYGAKDLSAALIGIDPEREKRVSSVADDLVAGSLDALLTTEKGIILGQMLADKLALGMGDRLTVISSAGTAWNMKIVGLLRTGVTQVDETTAYVLLTDAQVLLDRPDSANRLNIKLADPYDASELARRIEARIGYRAESWQEANADVLSVLVIRNIIFYTIVAAILVVASFGIFNVVSTVVLEKSRDIAILKSIGFREADMRRVFVLEGLAVGAVGTLAGWAIGYGLIAALASIRLQVGSMIQTERLPLDLGPSHFLISGAFAIASAVLAAWLPARRAARVKPVDILRGAA